MYRAKLCLSTSAAFAKTDEEQITMFKKAGFDGFFVCWYPGIDVESLRKKADEEEMLFQSIHAPFGKMHHMWTDSKEGEEARNELIACIRDCEKAQVPIVILHAFIGFEDHSPNEYGLKNFELVVKEAEKRNVKIAFENTEGIEYLDALMEYFKGNETVGFCWDSGHEQCYNWGADLLAKYGDRLLATHINDNLGILDYNGKITWTDDLHLLPFDGIIDWKDAANRLDACGFGDVLTFELVMGSKPNRHENDKYEEMGIERYLAEAFCRACKVASLRKR